MKKSKVKELLLEIEIISAMFVILGIWTFFSLKEYWLGTFLIIVGTYKQLQPTITKKVKEVFSQ